MSLRLARRESTLGIVNNEREGSYVSGVELEELRLTFAQGSSYDLVYMSRTSRVSTALRTVRKPETGNFLLSMNMSEYDMTVDRPSVSQPNRP